MSAPRHLSRPCVGAASATKDADRAFAAEAAPSGAHHLPESGFYFAPGTVEEHRRPSVLRAWLHVAAILAVLAAVGFVSGYLNT